ncbi:MAG: Ref family recombination enhancement nuclease [Thiomicrorhabdus sp.]|nr:Ref family recombination enhancement nuclease [Thiomicrorhabdus sp.]
MAKRRMNKHDREYLSKVADLGCIVCRNNGFPDTPTEIHHLRSGAGAGQRSKQAIPLCPIHHRTGGYGEVGFHQLPRTFEDRYGTEDELLGQVDLLIGISTHQTIAS